MESNNSPFSDSFTFSDSPPVQTASLFGIVGTSGKVEKLAAKFGKNSEIQEAIKAVKEQKELLGTNRLDEDSVSLVLQQANAEELHQISRAVRTNPNTGEVDEVLRIGVQKYQQAKTPEERQSLATAVTRYSVHKWLAKEVGMDENPVSLFDRTNQILTGNQADIEALSSMAKKAGLTRDDVLNYRYKTGNEYLGNFDAIKEAFRKDLFETLKEFPIEGAHSKEELQQIIAEGAGTKYFAVDPDMSNKLVGNNEVSNLFKQQEKELLYENITEKSVPTTITQQTEDPFRAAAILRRWYKNNERLDYNGVVNLFGNQRSVVEDPVSLGELLFVNAAKRGEVYSQPVLVKLADKVKNTLIDVESIEELKEKFYNTFYSFDKKTVDKIRDYYLQNHEDITYLIQSNIQKEKKRLAETAEIAVKDVETGEIVTGTAIHVRLRQEKGWPTDDWVRYSDGYYDKKTKTFYDRDEFGKIIEESKTFENLFDSEGKPVLGYLVDQYTGQPIAESVKLKEARVLKKIEEGKGPDSTK